MGAIDQKRIYKFVRLFAAIITVIAIAAMSVGCSLFNGLFGTDKIEFSVSNVNIQVGEKYDLTQIITSNKSSYSLTSSDPAVVSINSSTRVITAESVGIAYVTADTGAASARLKVSVTEKEPDALTITAEGELIQTVGDLTAVLFIPKATGTVANNDFVYWYVNGAAAKALGMTDRFSFTPTDVGDYEVTAKSGGVESDKITLRVFNPVSVEIEVNGEVIQDVQPFGDVVFTVNITDDTNAYNYFQFYEDGNILYEGSDSPYVYKPTPGRHTLTVKVNGKTEYSSEASFRGAVEVGEISVEFDNLYPHVYLVHDAVGKAQVEITSPLGVVKEYSQNNSAYSALFTDNGFDMGDIIALCADGTTRRTYKFRVKSLGDGDVLTESAYSDYFIFTQLPSGAAKYISTILPCGDLYVTSDIEYTAIVEHYIYFRKKGGNAAVSFDCYIGYDRQGSAQDLWSDAFPIAATSGIYSNISVADIGAAVMRTSFTVSTSNTPTTQTSGTASDYAQELRAILPHINYDEQKYRPIDYEFAIDRRQRSVSVSYSDELYLAAQNGVKPVPVSGSTAATVYDLARDILRKICTDDMTDVQKAHAIYDWIMWQVTYDTPVTNITGGESYAAYYLEGVFGDNLTPIGGVKYKPYAVCDGMSKAYSLLCNIEGIPCVRVVGKAGNSLRDAGGHAWNKVFVNDNWYIVDCTWGDSHGTLTLDGKIAEYELGLHDYLFVTDSMVSSTHFEPYRYGETSIIYTPRTAAAPIDVYSDMEVNGTIINCKIAKGENALNRIREISTAFAKAYEKRSTVTVPGGISNGEYSVNYQGIELYAESALTLGDNTIASTITSAIKAVHKSAVVKVVTLNNVIMILMRT